MRIRDRLAFGGRHEDRVTSISVFEHGGEALPGIDVAAGDIAKLWGLAKVRIGDSIGEPQRRSDQTYFAPPTLETVVVPADPRQNGRALHSAHPAGRAGPADQPAPGRPPSGAVGFALRRGAEGGHPGDAGERLRGRRSPSARRQRSASSGCVGTGEAVEFISQRRRTPSWLRSDCGSSRHPSAAGSRSELAVERGPMPAAFFRAVEETVRETVRPGAFRLEDPGRPGDDDALGLLRRDRATPTRPSTSRCRVPAGTSAA